jgi:urocanate hydratase
VRRSTQLHLKVVGGTSGRGQVSSSDGQHFYLCGEGETGGVNTSGEAIHVLDGLVNHDSAIDIWAHHTDGHRLTAASGRKGQHPQDAGQQKPNRLPELVLAAVVRAMSGMKVPAAHGFHVFFEHDSSIKYTYPA